MGPHLTSPRRTVDAGLLVLTVLALPLGGLLHGLGRAGIGSGIWQAVAVLVAVWLAVEIVRRLLRREVGVDLLALLAIGGSVLLGQALVAAVIALMLAGGRALEDYTERRAERELRALVERAPRNAQRYRDGDLETVPVEQVTPGDRLLVRSGEVVPVDGRLLSDNATLDASALTGESLPERHARDAMVRSGVVNAGAPFDMQAEQGAAQSTYAGIVHMVEQARGARAPFMRLADRYALALIPLTLVLAGAGWLWSGDPLRALAVLVVATPCPLILAVPVAIMAGMSRCARRGILVRTGSALEALARARILFLDKTGTLTAGRAEVRAVESAGDLDTDRLLTLAASLAQASPHVVAQAIVQAARSHRLALQSPQQVHESAGEGLEGDVDGHRVRLGGHAYVAKGLVARSDWAGQVLRRMDYEALGGSFIAVDGALAGAVLFTDPLRLESPRALRRLRRAGIARIVMLTGDRESHARLIGLTAGVDEIHAGLSPAAKLEAITRGRLDGVTLMVGDGINDAPALAAADIGIALGARGASASSEAAGVVLLTDRLDRVAEALDIARRSRRIALGGVWGGMGLAVLAMVLAVGGWLLPLAGAIVQEVIDVAVILNALRALGDGRRGHVALDSGQVDQLRSEHAALEPLLERVHVAAERLQAHTPERARIELAALVADLERHLLPHERADESTLYPQLAGHLGGDDPLAAMSHTHRELFRLIHMLGRMARATTAQPDEMQHLLLRLDALLELHFAQEEELYQHLDPR